MAAAAAAVGDVFSLLVHNLLDNERFDRRIIIIVAKILLDDLLSCYMSSSM